MDVHSHYAPYMRAVLVRTAEGKKFDAHWNGIYWVDENTGSRMTGHEVTHFYMYDRFYLDM